MRSFLRRRQVVDYISMYEKKELGLIKDDMYEMRKSSLLRQQMIKLKDFKDFIDDTKNFPSTGFYYGEQLNAFRNSFIPKKPVFQVLFDSTLYCKLQSFEGKKIERFLNHMSSHKNTKYLILDFRDNFSGELEWGFKLVNSLTKNCELFKIRYKLKEEKYFSDREQRVFERIYVLVNEKSEHISELVTLTLAKELNNVIVVGTQTMNQRIGQENFFDEKNRMLKLSCYRWDAGDEKVDDLLHPRLCSIEDVYNDIKG